MLHFLVRPDLLVESTTGSVRVSLLVLKNHCAIELELADQMDAMEVLKLMAL